jgi:hypothetical protein
MKPLSSSDLSALSRYPVSLQQAARALWGVEKDRADDVVPGHLAQQRDAANAVHMPDKA